MTDKEHCTKWYLNQGINPRTGRKIKIGGPTYKKLEKECGPKSKKSSPKSKKSSPKSKKSSPKPKKSKRKPKKSKPSPKASEIKTQTYEQCITFDDIELREHQLKVVDFMVNSNQKGLLAFHTVGSGKTITAITSAKCLLAMKKFENLKVIILTPVSVAAQFKKEVERLIKDKEILKRIMIQSHSYWLNRYEKGEYTARNSFMIIDEVHKFKSAGAKRAALLIRATNEAKKILLLTATPAENDPNEIRNYMAMINNRSFKKEYKKYEEEVEEYILEEEDEKEKEERLKKEKKKNKKKSFFKRIFKEKNNALVGEVRIPKIVKDPNVPIHKYLKCKFSYFKSLKDINNFPDKEERVVQLKMTPAFQKEYENIESKKINQSLKDTFNVGDKRDEDINLSVFLNGVRRAVNGLNMPSPKLEWIKEHVLRRVSKKEKVIIYSNWVKFGIDEVEKFLINEKIKYGKIVGSVSKANRLQIMNDYNSNKIMVMLITSAGAEGLDLKETRSMVIMEPYWHPSRIDQVIGRAVRYKSHANLPVKDRKVDIYHLLLVKKRHKDNAKDAVKNWFNKNIMNEKNKVEKEEAKLSVDVILFNLTNFKREKINLFYEYIKHNSIENKKC